MHDPSIIVFKPIIGICTFVRNDSYTFLNDGHITLPLNNVFVLIRSSMCNKSSHFISIFVVACWTQFFPILMAEILSSLTNVIMQRFIIFVIYAEMTASI